jgi:predicted nucleic acid-binding protein
MTATTPFSALMILENACSKSGTAVSSRPRRRSSDRPAKNAPSALLTDAIIVDASVAAKWLFAEDFSENALALLRDLTGLGRPVVGPPHLNAELTNVVYQRLRSGEITSQGAGEALRRFLDLGVQLVEPPETYETALAIARQYELPTTYDSLYVALAHDLEADFWTDDRQLKTMLGSDFPWVRLIATYPTKPFGSP